MNSASLKSLPVSILISDPWEFGTECGTGPFTGMVTEAAADRLLITLSLPIQYQGKVFRTVVAGPRYIGVDVASVAATAMPSNLMLLPMEIGSLSELRPNSQRAGIAAIGTIEKLVSSPERLATR
jgi:hypothetical protein